MNDTGQSATARQTKSRRKPRRHIPSGLSDGSKLDAALALAEAGVFVIPVHPFVHDSKDQRHSGKNPGSYLGRGWDALSSCSPEKIREWWGRWPEAEIAIHVGRSGLVALDVDRPDLVPGWLWAYLDEAAFQSSDDAVPRKGHYVFRKRSGRSYSNSRGALALASKEQWGEVRGENGVIMTQPSDHPRADDGGHYLWLRLWLRSLPEKVSDKLNEAAVNERPLSDSALATFLNEHTAEPFPSWARGPASKFLAETGTTDDSPGVGRHDAMAKALCWGFRDAYSGLACSVQSVYDELEGAWDEAFSTSTSTKGALRVVGRTSADPEEFRALAAWAAAQAQAEDLGALQDRVQEQIKKQRSRTFGALEGDEESDDERFPIITPIQLAQPVPPLEWLIRGVWPVNSYGPIGAEKKTLKSYNLLAMAVAVASGEPLFGKFPVERQGPVLVYVGEGGQETVQYRLQIICAKQGLSVNKLPIYVVDTVASLDDPHFRGQLSRRIDKHEPVLVAIDPLYAFHPEGIEAQNLYSRGAMLTRLSQLVGGRCALMVADHFNKVNEGPLDLNMISQAGMSQWADSWFLARHRNAASKSGESGTYQLEVTFGSRRTSGGARWDLDWKLPYEEDEYGVHIPAAVGCEARDGVSWNIQKSNPIADKAKQTDAAKAENLGKAVKAIVQYVRDGEWQVTQTQAVSFVGGNAELARAAMDDAILHGHVVEEKRKRKEGQREVQRNLLGLGPGDGKVHLQATRNKPGEDQDNPAESVDGAP